MIKASLIECFSETSRDDRNTVAKSILNKFLDDTYFNVKVENISSSTSVTRYSIKVPPKLIRYVLKCTPMFNAFFDTNSCRLQQDGKYLSIEVPNKYRGTYGFKDSVSSLQTISDHDDKIWVAIGEGLDGKCIMHNLSDMPHLLVAGQTGSGKSVFLHNIILSILIQYSKDNVNVILIDPKRVEFGLYRGAPQVREVVTTTDRAVRRIRDLCDEMDNRYEIFADVGVRDISSYNKISEIKMPRVVVVIEELADLVLATESPILEDITRLVIKARASGIHVILATQRPEAEFIGGKLRSNFQCRVAFSVPTVTDSRVILGHKGAERLKGKGDGIFRVSGGQGDIRFQSALITEKEISNAVKILSESEATDGN